MGESHVTCLNPEINKGENQPSKITAEIRIFPINFISLYPTKVFIVMAEHAAATIKNAMKNNFPTFAKNNC